MAPLPNIKVAPHPITTIGLFGPSPPLGVCPYRHRYQCLKQIYDLGVHTSAPAAATDAAASAAASVAAGVLLLLVLVLL